MLNPRYRPNYGRIWTITYETEGEKVLVTRILRFLKLYYIYQRDK